jgi:hypothetical protein
MQTGLGRAGLAGTARTLGVDTRGVVAVRDPA